MILFQRTNTQPNSILNDNGIWFLTNSEYKIPVFSSIWTFLLHIKNQFVECESFIHWHFPYHSLKFLLQYDFKAHTR